jgi:hypothetical protein
MNKERRNLISGIIKDLESIRTTIEGLQADITEATSGEEEYYENMPESIQSGDRGEQAAQAVETLTTVQDQINEFDIDAMVTDLESIINQ